jgi:hypothetical protein
MSSVIKPLLYKFKSESRPDKPVHHPIKQRNEPCQLPTRYFRIQKYLRCKEIIQAVSVPLKSAIPSIVTILHRIYTRPQRSQGPD